jgi:hypothetical protein
MTHRNETTFLKEVFVPGLVLALFFSCLLTLRIFSEIDHPYFLFIHDEYFPFSADDLTLTLSVISDLDFGTSNTFQLMVNFLDRIYYFTTYSFGATLQQAQIALFSIKLFILIYVSRFGFVRLAESLSINCSKLVISVVTLWYAFNPFTFLYLHGNAFPLTLVVCYCLAPYALYKYKAVVFLSLETRGRPPHIRDVVLLSITLFLMAFALYFFAPFILLLAAYTFIYVLFQERKVCSGILKNLFKLIVACLPLFAIHYFVLYEMFFLSSAANNSTGNETHGNLAGGLLYQLLMWFTWPMYVVWTPRNFWTFTEYLRTFHALLAPFVMYLMIIIGLSRQPKNLSILILILLLLLFYLFAKGPQEPFGFIYLYLLENLPGFRVFRSPDTKFGFVIVFILAILALKSSARLRTGIFVTIFGLVIIVQNWPIIIGYGLWGQNTDTSKDRVILIPDEYKELEDFFKSDSNVTGYVLTVPSVENGRFALTDEEEHSGQDLLPKIINRPFVYLSSSSGMPRPTYETMKRAFEDGEFSELRNLGIRYYISRTEIISERQKYRDINLFLRKNYNEVFRNDIFVVFEDPLASPTINLSGPPHHSNKPYAIHFEIPTEYEGDIILNRNFHSEWEIFRSEMSEGITSIFFDFPVIGSFLETASYAFRDPVLKSTHFLVGGFSNGWRAERTSNLGSDKGSSVNLVAVYVPQAIFFILMGISTVLFIVYLLLSLRCISSKKTLSPRYNDHAL